MVHQESYIGEAINSIQESRRAFNNLTLLATIEYGDSFWLNDEFQQSDIAAMMESTAPTYTILCTSLVLL